MDRVYDGTAFQEEGGGNGHLSRARREEFLGKLIDCLRSFVQAFYRSLLF